jgi:stage V sporulation protein R
MVLDSLIHPPHIEIESKKENNGILHLVHRFESKPLVKDYIKNTMLGIEFLWGKPVQLDTHELVSSPQPRLSAPSGRRRELDEGEKKWQRVRYTMENRKLTKTIQ